MSRELNVDYPSSYTLYAVIRRPSDSKRWYTVTPIFETFNATHLTTGTYTITMTDDTADAYYGDFPTAIVSGAYDAMVYLRVGASPAEGDPLIANIPIQWNGTTVTSATPGANQRTIGNLTDILQESARNAGIPGTWSNDPYSLTMGHHAVRSSIDRFIRETRCTRRTSTATTTDGTATITFA